MFEQNPTESRAGLAQAVPAGMPRMLEERCSILKGVSDFWWARLAPSESLTAPSKAWLLYVLNTCLLITILQWLPSVTHVGA